VRDPPRIHDNENNRAIIAARLGAQGYSTFEACDGGDALEAVRREPPDLILLDVTMPKIDGLEACRRLKSDASLGFIPVILVTARSDSKDVVAGLEAGVDEYLTKPVDQPALVARVRSMLRVKELHDRYACRYARNQTDERAHQPRNQADERSDQAHYCSLARLRRSRRNSSGSKRTPRYCTRSVPLRSTIDVRNVWSTSPSASFAANAP